MPLPRLLSAQLRNRIEVSRSTQVDDGRGGLTTTWAPLARLWAEVQGQDGREALIAQALQGISVYRIRIYWRADKPRQDDQIVFEGQTLNIRSVYDPNGDREQLVILADTGSARTVG